MIPGCRPAHLQHFDLESPENSSPPDPKIANELGQGPEPYAVSGLQFNLSLSTKIRTPLARLSLPKMAAFSPLPIHVLRPQPGHVHTHTIIFLHGRGSNSREFASELLESEVGPGFCLRPPLPSTTLSKPGLGGVGVGSSSSSSVLTPAAALAYHPRGRALQDLFPSLRWVFPQAPYPWPALAADGGDADRGRQWFDIGRVTRRDELGDADDPGGARRAQIREAAAGLGAVLRDEVDRLEQHLLAEEEAEGSGGAAADGDAAGAAGVRDQAQTQARTSRRGRARRRVFLAGISQGFALACLAHLVQPGGGDNTPLGGLLGFSSWMQLGARIRADLDAAGDEADMGAAALVLFEGQDVGGREGNDAAAQTVQETPVFLAHSQDDGTVPVELGRALRDLLRRLGAHQVEWHEYPDGGHWFNEPLGIEDLAAFLRTCWE